MINLSRYVFLLSSTIVLLTGYCEALFETKKKERMIDDLECIKRTMQVQYAPTEWKKKYLQWDLDAEFSKAAQRIVDAPFVTTKDFQQIVKEFLGSTQDYHVDIAFYSTEKAFLPFSIKTINNKCLVDWIDTNYWPFDQGVIQQGDELIEFDGRPVQKMLDEIIQRNGRLANTLTDQALADNSLTMRLGAAGDKVPQGLIHVAIKSAETGEIKNYQLNWYYQPEKIASPFDLSFADAIGLHSLKKPSHEDQLKAILKGHVMISSLHQIRLEECEMRHGELGAAKSFLPILGDPIWKYDLGEIAKIDKGSHGHLLKSSALAYTIGWFAYIYKNEEGQSIGYLRIPHYSGDEEDFFNLLPVIAYLEKNTDALVLDQLNNSGGYVSFMNKLLSLLSSEPLLMPKHQVAINQKEVMEALENIEELKFHVNLNEGDDSKSQENGKFCQLINYYQFILEEWNQGHALTNPTHLGGVDYVEPHPRIHYTKPILMLINELDFSAGDLMPAILQDSGRATLMGTPTAGAGGAVTHFSFPNLHGIKLISFTETIAERINLQKIENLGVIPDIEYKLSEEDLRYNYQDYKAAINQAVSSLINRCV